MNFSFKLDNDVLVVSLVGRLDTDASMSFEKELAVISQENPHGSLVFDASELEYIASSGLRTMLKMAKTEKNFKIRRLSGLSKTNVPNVLKLKQIPMTVDKNTATA